MSIMNQELRLGNKALLLYLARWMTWPFLIFVIALILSGFKNTATAGLVQMMPANQAAIDSSATAVLSGLFLLAIVLLFSGFLVAYLSYRTYTFSLEEYDLKVRRGILNREEVSIPYRQIQDVSVNRSLWYRLLGVSRVVLTTAGQDEAGELDQTDGVLDPIDRDLGEEVRQELERRIGVQLVENEPIPNAATAPRR